MRVLTVVSTTFNELLSTLRPHMKKEGYSVDMIYAVNVNWWLFRDPFFVSVASTYSLEIRYDYDFPSFMEECKAQKGEYLMDVGYFLAECCSRGWIPKGDYLIDSKIFDA